ncbi:Amino acid permease [Rhizoctonia solani]|uniref:Amino acid permease n=1 Tax=Rhizoctonia solani TaxID=456999 RepID=A0A8H7IEC0_9AGAM|nr:Amino acid permease [Rhizoctonia solani]
MQPLVNPDDPVLYESEDTGQELTALVPIEETSPLGYNVNFFNATLMNTSAMIGMGIFSTPSFILKSVGSVGLLISLYLLVPLITLAGLMVYIELTSMCGHKRAMSFPRKKHIQTKIPTPHCLRARNCFAESCWSELYVFAKHVLHGYDIEATPFRQRSIAIAMSTVAIWVNGIAAFFKIGCLVLISVTGLACLFGWTPVPNSGNLRRPFDGSLYEANPFATSIVKVLYNFVGWNSILGLMAEVKGRHPVHTIQKAGITSVLITAFLFITTLLSFSIVLTKEELMNADEVLGAIFLRKVYGDTVATKLFLFLLGLVLSEDSISDIVLWKNATRGRKARNAPFATFWSRIGRFKTPYGPVLLKWALAVFLIIVTPAHDTVVFLIDLASYPALVFSLLVGCGVWILRHRRERLGLPEHAYKAPDFVVAVYVLQSIALLIMPWIPPKGGSKGGDVGFFYATYCLCGFYYWVRFCALPQWLGYDLVEETISLPGGVKVMVLKKVYKESTESQEEPLLRGERDD